MFGSIQRLTHFLNVSHTIDDIKWLLQMGRTARASCKCTKNSWNYDKFVCHFHVGAEAVSRVKNVYSNGQTNNNSWNIFLRAVNWRPNRIFSNEMNNDEWLTFPLCFVAHTIIRMLGHWPSPTRNYRTHTQPRQSSVARAIYHFSR